MLSPLSETLCFIILILNDVFVGLGPFNTVANYEMH